MRNVYVLELKKTASYYEKLLSLFDEMKCNYSDDSSQYHAQLSQRAEIRMLIVNKLSEARECGGVWIESQEMFYDAEFQSEYPRKCYKCSVCGRVEWDKEQYCHCGAKMLERTASKSSDMLSVCPFCGSHPITVEDQSDVILYQIRCNNENCWIGPYTSFYSEKSTAVEAWETRRKVY